MEDGRPPPFRLVISSDADNTTIVVGGELDLATGQTLTEKIARLDVDPSTSQVIVDLGEITFIDVAGIRSLVRSRELLRERGLRVRFSRMSDVTRRVAALTGMDIEPELTSLN